MIKTVSIAKVGNFEKMSFNECEELEIGGRQLGEDGREIQIGERRRTSG